MSQPSRAEWAATRAVSLPAAWWRHRWLIVAVAVVGALAGYGLSFLGGTTYTADGQIVIADPRGVYQDEVLQLSPDPTRAVRNAAVIADSREVAERAAEQLGDPYTTDRVVSDASAAGVDGRDLLVISGTGATPEEAQAVANAVADAFIAVSAETNQAALDAALSELEATQSEVAGELAALLGSDALEAIAQRDALAAEISRLETRMTQFRSDADLFGDGTARYQPAPLPTSPSSRSPLALAIVGGLLGLVAAGSYAWWRAEMMPLAERSGDAEPILRAPLLAVVPPYSGDGVTSPPTVSAPDSLAAERYQYAMSALALLVRDDKARTVLVTSAHPGGGKTAAVVNLAAAAALGGTRPLLVDADRRTRTLSIAAGASGSGLTELALEDGVTVTDCARAWTLAGRVSVGVIGAGAAPPNGTSFFRSDAFRRAVVEIRDSAALALIDSPAVLSAAEAADIAAGADAILVVVAAGTPQRSLRQLHDRLAMSGRPILGYVFTEARRPAPWRRGRKGAPAGT